MKETNQYRIIDRMGDFICQRKYAGKRLWRDLEEWQDMNRTVSDLDFHWYGCEFTNLKDAGRWLSHEIEDEAYKAKIYKEAEERDAKLRARGTIVVKEITA